MGLAGLDRDQFKDRKTLSCFTRHILIGLFLTEPSLHSSLVLAPFTTVNIDGKDKVS